MEEQHQSSFQQAKEAVSILSKTKFDTGTERGCQPKSALEWLAWRDAQVFLLEKFKEGVANVLPTNLYRNGESMPQWWKLGVVEGMAVCFRRAEFMVWGEPQWKEVVHSSPAFEGSSISVPEHCWMLWTWPGDRKTDPEGRKSYGIPDGFDLGAMAVYALPMVDPRRAEAFRQKVSGLGSFEGVSGSQLAENFINTDATIAFYFTPDDALIGPDYWSWVTRRAHDRGGPDWRDLVPILPRIVTLPHFRDQPVKKGWEIVPAALGFLRERIFVPEKAELSRQQRRQYERSHPGARSDIQIIQLRRTESEAHPASGDGREYSCRWWVGGHWRKRSKVWQRGEGPIWVNAYVKGPDGAPIKSKSKRLVRVER